MIIGLSGTHGTGKTTVLEAAVEAGAYAHRVQLSRTAQAQLGWDSLARAGESAENMWALQDAILIAMYDRDQELRKQPGLVSIVERTPADLWAYTSMWCMRLNIDRRSERVRLYKNKCRDMANAYAKIVLVPPVREIPFVEEPNRADLKSREFVRMEIENFLQSGGLPYITMRAISRDARQAEIQTIITMARAFGQNS